MNKYIIKFQDGDDYKWVVVPERNTIQDIEQLFNQLSIEDFKDLLKDVKGVTVLIHDQSCAANLRRLRKRGLVHEPKKRIFINENSNKFFTKTWLVE